MKSANFLKKPKYSLNPSGEFIIENFNYAKPFASFFPGIAGPYGIPIWVFYVNRGQAISSFGTKDKDHSILEFFPANKAWQMTSLQGFRSFVKLSQKKDFTFYEPFHNGPENSKFNLSNRMFITAYGLKIEEENFSLGLKIDVEYFTVPNDKFGALARIVTIKNTSKNLKTLQLLDGLAQIVPFGTNNFFLKKMSRTIEAWMNVKNLENNVPFYKLAVDPQDRPEVVHIEEGNFYLAFEYDNGRPKIIKPIVDPQSVFGPVTDLTMPYHFLNKQTFRYPKNETIQNKMPSGFLFSDFRLGPFEEKSFYTAAGYITNQQTLNSLVPKITAFSYLENKRAENKKIIKELQADIDTKSSSPEFNLYARQTYLDNILRGGYPMTFESDSHKSIFYLYSRKHGDLERDYNRFHIQATYFSQGNGNYRDINQNRRSDIWFNPGIKDENIIAFFNLLQTDGFNPLIVKGVTFTLKNQLEFKQTLNGKTNEKNIAKLLDFLAKPFTPGELILFLEKNDIRLSESYSYNEFLNLTLAHSVKTQEAEHGEGFWTDHWTYNLDLLESYLAVYPENLKEIVFDKKVFIYYDNSEVVRPRAEKIILYNGQIKQLHSLIHDSAKKEMLHKRKLLANIVRKDFGNGEIYETTLINKLLCLTVNKMASLDPLGVGIEMEADKPNWFDSLNGLPALLGSSVCETFELKRLALFIKNAISKTQLQNLSITEEIKQFLFGLGELTKDYFGSDVQNKDYLFWDKTHSLKEDFRHKTRFGLSGNESEISAAELDRILDDFLKKLDSGIDKACDKKNNVYYAYFINEVTEYQQLNTPFVRPLKFKQIKLPLFLEAQVHSIRLVNDTKQAKAIYTGVKKSALYDKRLKMFKVTAPLDKMPEEIGRCRIFTPGWLENESIWLHMEYKYLLEILRSGLHEDFYNEFKSVLIPFQKPAVYGRSILENSSFLVSSAFPDKNLWGNGFVARLSGSTAEFLHIWLIMNLGIKPFFLNEKNELNLQIKPILSGWLFDKKGNYSFNFLSKIRMNYYNPKRANTYGKTGVKINRITFNDANKNPIEIASDTIPAPYAEQIRRRQITQINAYLG